MSVLISDVATGLWDAVFADLNAGRWDAGRTSEQSPKLNAFVAFQGMAGRCLLGLQTRYQARHK